MRLGLLMPVWSCGRVVDGQLIVEYAHSHVKGYQTFGSGKQRQLGSYFCRVFVVGFTRAAPKLNDMPNICLYHIYKCPTVLSRSCGQLRFRVYSHFQFTTQGRRRPKHSFVRVWFALASNIIRDLFREGQSYVFSPSVLAIVHAAQPLLQLGFLWLGLPFIITSLLRKLQECLRILSPTSKECSEVGWWQCLWVPPRHFSEPSFLSPLGESGRQILGTQVIFSQAVSSCSILIQQGKKLATALHFRQILHTLPRVSLREGSLFFMSIY